MAVLGARSPAAGASRTARRGARRAPRRAAGLAARAAGDGGEPAGAAPASGEAPKADVCALCGSADKKCDGTGRVAGGLGAVLGWEWWPIRAYRPCPELIARGGTYTKAGQDIDEVLFGNDK